MKKREWEKKKRVIVYLKVIFIKEEGYQEEYPTNAG